MTPAALEALRLAAAVAGDIDSEAPNASAMYELQVERLTSTELRELVEVLLAELMESVLIGADALDIPRQVAVDGWVAALEERHRGVVAGG